MLSPSPMSIFRNDKGYKTALTESLKVFLGADCYSWSCRLGRMHRAVQTLLWVIVENAMAPKEVREASGLEGTQQISTEIYR